MKALEMVHEVDPREELLKRLGDLSQYEVFGNQILLAIYERPEKTKSGLYLSDKTRQEDQFQGKAAMVAKLGPAAFVSDENYNFHGQKVKVGDWVAVFVSDGRKLLVNSVLCRLVEDHHIRIKLPVPDSVY